jgi:hypothetical protein
MTLTVDDLFASPDHYLHHFDGDAALFVPMDRAAYHRSIFLDGRIDPAGPGTMRVPIAAIAGRRRAAQRTAWIFHVAHCGSTLLARALDRGSGGGLVLREPQALRQVAIAPDPARLALIAAMLGKRYAGEQSAVDWPTIVKANVPVNFLLPQLAAMDPAAPAIFLHLALDDYLLAILRSDAHRGWLRNVTTQLAAHLGDLSALSDAERAGALWLAQHRAFTTALAAMPNGRSLDAELFFAEPAAVLEITAAHLGQPMAEGEARRIVAGPLFAAHAKNPALPFDEAARRARRAELAGQIAAEIAAARLWVTRTAGAGAPDQSLPRPLMARDA